jgi:hypothetical protein
MIVFIDTLFTQLGTTDNYSAISDLHALQFTVKHALVFSVFTSRTLTTDFNIVVIPVSHMKFTSHSLISFFPFFCNCQLNSTPLLPSSYPGRDGKPLAMMHHIRLLLVPVTADSVHIYLVQPPNYTMGF